MRDKHLYTKVILIILSEALAIVITDLVSKYIVQIHHTTLSYIICGALLAYIVVGAYDHLRYRRRRRIRRELQDLTDAALMRYSVQDKDQHN